VHPHVQERAAAAVSEDLEVKAVSEAVFDPFEYFVLRHRDGLLKTDFKASLGKVSYHIPCHSRVQNMGQKTREALQLVPGTTLNTVERCAGHDGTWASSPSTTRTR